MKMIKDTNPDHYKVDGANFIKYMNDQKISGFGNWMFANGFNSGVWASSNWISVKDRLPEMYKAVLGYAPYHNNVWAVTMRENGEWYIWSPVSRRYDPDFEGPITHWMPMPEPPKEEN
jgi:hypothetical protein